LCTGSQNAFAAPAAEDEVAAVEQSTVTLNDGKKMPKLSLGLWMSSLDSPAETHVALHEALACGYRSIDVATVYNNEDIIGDAFRKSLLKRENVFITVKIWNEEHGINKAQKAIEKSLRRLGMSYVDLVLIQWPNPTQNLYVDTWLALIRMREKGLTRSIGVANFNEKQLRRLISETGIKPVLNQTRINPYMQRNELRAVHEQLGIYTQTWSPLARGRISDDQLIQGIAEKHDKTVAQIAIRWHLQNDIIVVSRSSKPERIRENFDVFDFTLDAEDMKTIASLDGFV
jgi:2,5-diketo-D-gluconate reductase A